jgi:hypothetical protein
LALTSHIEAGLQRKLKTGVVFIDLICVHHRMERWRNIEIHAGRSLCQAAEFTEQYVIKSFLPSLKAVYGVFQDQADSKFFLG